MHDLGKSRLEPLTVGLDTRQQHEAAVRQQTRGGGLESGDYVDPTGHPFVTTMRGLLGVTAKPHPNQTSIQLRLLLPSSDRREVDHLDRHIDEVLGTVKWISKFKEGLLYIVGGAWRSLGRLEIARIRYPIRVLHGYAMYADRVSDMCRLFAGLSLESLSRIEVAPRDRLDTLAPAARVLGRLLHYSGAAKVVFSAHGLREGILFEHLTTIDQKIDPLLASCRLTWHMRRRTIVLSSTLHKI